MTSVSGHGAIVHYYDQLYELTCEISGCVWEMLPQKLSPGALGAVMMTLPPDYSNCGSCTAGFFGHFCEGKQNFFTYQTGIGLYRIHLSD